ncbi:cupin domain-containing protein [Methylobacterium sp. WL64]|uniref:cupin domain-containing protein n=1 Tax=Methylobacterium sp. WL64 TaxID=2603894 RepID=UPI0011C92FE6|nr:cupin domain-containing protein [Methylobacterium sp. WL64]TXM98851.1 cupin domain-containing protein [Methylobacterium sp. WL64]
MRMCWILAGVMAVGGLAAGAWAQSDRAPQERVTPTFQGAIPNVPGKSLVAAMVEYPPGGKSPAHRHAASAFVYAYVVSGAVRSRVGDAPERIYRAGESFSEPPGAHHAVSGNASDVEPARLLAVFVLDTGDHPLTTPDP